MRLFVCDPVCVQAFGHNVTALRYFTRAFREQYQAIVPLCCKLLDPSVVERENFVAFYNFYYHRYFPSVEAAEPAVPDGSDDAAFYPDEFERIATDDARRLLTSYEIGPEDDILFPHLDFYGVAGMLNALSEMHPDSRPHLLLRFIGVMENATITYRKPTAELLARVRAALESGITVRVSAETPRYADYVAAELGITVAVTGYPDEADAMPMRQDIPFTFYCPGSARFDKGFLDLAEIFGGIRRACGDLSIRFITQILPDRDLKDHLNSLLKIQAIPGVELQPSAIEAEDMIETFRRSHAVLLPYAADIYEFRGSAVLMEATAYGRPAITYEGTAFAELVRYYGLGKVVASPADMVKAALEMAAEDRDTLEVRAKQARFRYIRDNIASYQFWMKRP
ncbi:Glycosyltransferase involved in cell wall bisynthesis [Rhizobium sp. RU20A]|uniref:glycosyltransferase family 4 protein n=1 Tax=Rhizobium sp. RU20A TaxID=1907412 RepID=UPI000954D060|nr:glycosyltransferase family 4 protein [Rhizobium sp. RU20A]SIQ58869.1 Glycosyltransferase involved in cell wall bisynthesis [Rhizobium sp. RU20A]